MNFKWKQGKVEKIWGVWTIAHFSIKVAHIARMKAVFTEYYQKHYF